MNMIGRVWAALMAAANVKVWAQVGAGIALTVVMVGYGVAIWKGPWGADRQAQQIQWLGWGMILSGGLVLVALAALTGLNINVHAAKDGLSATLDQDDGQPTVAIETTTTTTVQQAPGGVDRPA